MSRDERVAALLAALDARKLSALRLELPGVVWDDAIAPIVKAITELALDEAAAVESQADLLASLETSLGLRRVVLTRKERNVIEFARHASRSLHEESVLRGVVAKWDAAS